MRYMVRGMLLGRSLLGTASEMPEAFSESIPYETGWGVPIVIPN